MRTKHFAGLDGLRFISITFVVLHHLFTFKTNFGLVHYDYPILWLIGFYGIQFFFMGSGFLITYLLLAEHARTGKINLRDFFIRRILRIWPGYYLLIILALVVALTVPFFRIPGTTDNYLAANPQKSNMLFFFFLPHIESFKYPTAPYVHHTYTIGIEEQFYFLWGLLFVFCFRYTHKIFIGLIVLMPLLNFFHEKTFDYLQQHPSAPAALQYANSVITYLKFSRPSTFAIGAVFGSAYFHGRQWIQVFKKVPVQLIIYLLLAGSIYFQVEVPYAQFEYISLVMACVMMIATFRRESLINYSARWLESLGRISYGIYLYHIFAIVLTVKFVTEILHWEETNLLQLIALCFFTLCLSVVFGWFSYNYFEKYFLRFKQRFRKIRTGHL